MATSAAVPYSLLVVDHFDQPRNVGRMSSAEDVVDAEAGSRVQGTQFHLSARVVGDRVSAVHFEAYGCPHCVAAGSWLTQRLAGSTVEELPALDLA